MNSESVFGLRSEEILLFGLWLAGLKTSRINQSCTHSWVSTKGTHIYASAVRVKGRRAHLLPQQKFDLPALWATGAVSDKHRITLRPLDCALPPRVVAHVCWELAQSSANIRP